VFRSLRSYNFRLWFLGGIVSNIGVWMQTTAQSWLVLTVLTDGDAVALGVTIALQYAPPLLLVPVSGWVTDRFDRRRLLLVTQTAFMVLAVALGLLVLLGRAELWQVYALSAAVGIVTAFDAPARHTFVSDLVTPEYLANAVALNTATYNLARLIGPAVAGFAIVAVGTGWVFIVNAATFPAMIVALLVMRRAQLIPRAHTGRVQRVTDGFHYIARRSDLLLVFVVSFLICAFALNFPLFAATMAVEFGQDADGFGLLTSALAVGSLAGALVAASRPRARIGLVAVAAGAFGVAAIVAGLMPSYWAFAGVLVLVGLSSTLGMTTSNAYVQTHTAPELRGRVLAIYLAVVMSGTPIGGLIAGWATAAWGPRSAIILAGAVGLVACVAGVVWLGARRRSHRQEVSMLTRANVGGVPAVIEQFSDDLALTPATAAGPRPRRTARFSRAVARSSPITPTNAATSCEAK